MYLPPGLPLSATDLFDLFSELPTPFFIVGDFNAYNSLWGSSRTYQRGAVLEQLLANNLFLLNTGEPTHICMATGSTSSIDLALCSLSIAPHLDWTVLSDLHGSDHFPVIIHISTPTPALEHAPHWIFARADWVKFQASLHLSDASFEDVSAMAQHFTDAILTASKANFPQSLGMACHFPVPWWNPDCAVVIRACKRALTLLQCHPTMENLINYKQLCSRAQRVVRDSKKSAWRAIYPVLLITHPPGMCGKKLKKQKERGPLVLSLDCL